MELQVGVKVLLKNKEGKYLLLRRSPKAYPEVGDQWDSVGGRIKPGKTLMENLRREVKEEVNLDLRGEPQLIAAQDILCVKGRHVVRLTYISTIEGTPKLGSDHIEYGWFSINELKNLKDLDPYVRELLDQGIFPRQSA